MHFQVVSLEQRAKQKFSYVMQYVKSGTVSLASSNLREQCTLGQPTATHAVMSREIAHLKARANRVKMWSELTFGVQSRKKLNAIFVFCDLLNLFSH